MKRRAMAAAAVLITMLASVSIADHRVLAGAGSAAGAVDAAAAPKTKLRASDLRVRLDRLLGEHAFLTAEAMRAGVKGGAEFEAAAEALEGNTADLQALIGDIYGAAGGRRFGELWRAHLGYVVDYTRAFAERDTTAQQAALRGLQKYRADFSRFLATANPHLPAKAVSGLLGEHITQLRQLASFVDRDYAKSYQSARNAYHHMFTMGDALSAAIVQQFPRSFSGAKAARSPALDLRIGLDRLLGEHTFLAAEAMRAGVSRAPDYAAARGALLANSTDLARSIRAVYGAGAQRAFLKLWNQHIDYYLDYIRATAAGDEAGKQKAREQIEAYPRVAGAFLAGANPNLQPEDVEDVIAEHGIQLLTQVDAYAAGDYSRAYATAREAYAHILVISDVLATAIAEQFPEIFPPLPATDVAPAVFCRVAPAPHAARRF